MGSEENNIDMPLSGGHEAAGGKSTGGKMEDVIRLQCAKPLLQAREEPCLLAW